MKKLSFLAFSRFTLFLMFIYIKEIVKLLRQGIGQI